MSQKIVGKIKSLCQDLAQGKSHASKTEKWSKLRDLFLPQIRQLSPLHLGQALQAIRLTPSSTSYSEAEKIFWKDLIAVLHPKASLLSPFALCQYATAIEKRCLNDMIASYGEDEKMAVRELPGVILRKLERCGANVSVYDASYLMHSISRFVCFSLERGGEGLSSNEIILWRRLVKRLSEMETNVGPTSLRLWNNIAVSVASLIQLSPEILTGEGREIHQKLFHVMERKLHQELTSHPSLLPPQLLKDVLSISCVLSRHHSVSESLLLILSQEKTLPHLLSFQAAHLSHSAEERQTIIHKLECESEIESGERSLREVSPILSVIHQYLSKLPTQHSVPSSLVYYVTQWKSLLHSSSPALRTIPPSHLIPLIDVLTRLNLADSLTTWRLFDLFLEPRSSKELKGANQSGRRPYFALPSPSLQLSSRLTQGEVYDLIFYLSRNGEGKIYADKSCLHPDGGAYSSLHFWECVGERISHRLDQSKILMVLSSFININYHSFQILTKIFSQYYFTYPSLKETASDRGANGRSLDGDAGVEKLLDSYLAILRSFGFLDTVHCVLSAESMPILQRVFECYEYLHQKLELECGRGKKEMGEERRGEESETLGWEERGEKEGSEVSRGKSNTLIAKEKENLFYLRSALFFYKINASERLTKLLFEQCKNSSHYVLSPFHASQWFLLYSAELNDQNFTVLRPHIFNLIKFILDKNSYSSQALLSIKSDCSHTENDTPSSTPAIDWFHSEEKEAHFSFTDEGFINATRIREKTNERRKLKTEETWKNNISASIFDNRIFVKQMTFLMHDFYFHCNNMAIKNQSVKEFFDGNFTLEEILMWRNLMNHIIKDENLMYFSPVSSDFHTDVRAALIDLIPHFSSQPGHAKRSYQIFEEAHAACYFIDMLLQHQTFPSSSNGALQINANQLVPTS